MRPIFKEMVNKIGHSHYITGNLDLYNEHCGNDEYCDKNNIRGKLHIQKIRELL